MKAIDSLFRQTKNIESSPALRRVMIAVSFGVSILTCQYFILLGLESGTASYWYVTLCFPIFPILAGIRGLKTASTLDGRERTAWIFIALGCGCMALADGFWGYLEFVNPSASPMTEWATTGYVFSPLCFLVGMLFYEDQSHVPGAQLVRLGNLGIVFSSVAFAYLLVVYQLLRWGETDVALIKTFQGAIIMAATVVGLVLLVLHSKGKKRAIMSLLVAGMFCVIAEYFGFIYALINDSSAWTNAYSALYLVASALWFAAASEQEYRPAEIQEPHELDERVQHAKQSETLLPAFAVASVFAVALFYGGDLSQEILPYLASTLCVLVASLGIRNWWAQRVEARLAQKLRDQATDLIKAKETAEASDIAKSRFLSWVSHETRTPLSGVLGFSELLENRHYGELNEEQAGFVQSIRESGNHLLELIDDLLDVTKITMGSVNLTLENVSPGDVVLEVVQNVESGSRGERVAIINEVGPDCPMLRVERRRLRQCLYNLLSNAVKFTSPGRAVGIRSRLDREGWLCLEVWDQGIGIEEKDLGRVFDDFYQVDSKRDEALGGSGIGLAVTRRLAQLHGGEVRAQSEVGRGSTFQLVMPIADPQLQVETIPGVARPLGEEAAEYSAEGELRLMVVDDEPANLAVIKGLLEVRGIEPIMATGGYEAVTLGNRERPYLVLMDIHMPDCDGFEALAQIRKNKTLAGVSVVAMTASASESDRARYVEAGFDGFLAKPINSAKLDDLLNDLAPGAKNEP